MAKVIFEFNSGKYTIQCLPTDYMSKLCQQFANKLQIKIESLIDAEKKEMIV